MKSIIHSTAIIDEGVQMGTGCKVWHWVYMKSGAKVGNNCRFGQNVYVASDVSIGNNVHIQANVSIYEQVTLEDEVFVGPNVAFTNVRNPRSSISRRGFLLATHVEKGVSIGANSTIICGVNIGRYALIGAGAVVNRSVPGYALMVGVPAKHIGWVSTRGQRLHLPLEGEGQAQCPSSGKTYILKNNSIHVTE